MEEGNENKSDYQPQNRNEIRSNVIRAGKRTYFIDVKPTRRQDLYITITESRRKANRSGRFFYEKQKMHLYPEDMDNFLEGLKEMVDFVAENNVVPEKPEYNNKEPQKVIKEDKTRESQLAEDFSNVQFEDLNNN